METNKLPKTKLKKRIGWTLFTIGIIIAGVSLYKTESYDWGDEFITAIIGGLMIGIGLAIRKEAIWEEMTPEERERAIEAMRREEEEFDKLRERWRKSPAFDVRPSNIFHDD